MIYYQPEVKMYYVDFISQMDTFLSKDSTSKSTSTLRIQKQPEILQLKWTEILIIKPFELTIKKQKPNLMISPWKVEYIRRKKTHNGHYYQ